MTQDKGWLAVEKRDEGLAMADRLLEDCRPMHGLPATAHARVKRRLEASMRRKSAPRLRWLQPVVIGGTLLVCGAAFGVVIDRLVLKRQSAPSKPQIAAAASTGKTARPGKGRAARISGKEDTLPDAPAALGEPTNPPVVAPAPTPGSEVPAAALRPAIPVASAARKRLAMRTLVSVEAQALPLSSAPSATPESPPTPPPATATPETSPPAAATSTAPLLPPTATPTFAIPSPSKPPSPPATPPPATQAPKPPPKSPNDGLTEERLLAAAVRALRAQKDARSALSALDEYRARYPQGRLSVEASILRVDTLTSLGRSDEALRTLDRLDLARVPGSLERHLQRAELRASAARWQEALADFDWVLAHTRAVDGDTVERALWGRTQSNAELENASAASANAREYLQRFPRGRFAAQATHIQSEGAR